MRALRLTSRERAVMRGIDETSGTLGSELLEHVHLEDTDLLDVLHGMVNAGLLETFAPGSEFPLVHDVPMEHFRTTRFELNPAFAQEIRQAMRRS